ncbi:hypothetical protein RUM44_006473 [Polyplax serrata]|uniref:Uncharacterized protein n=1 Tax=Polyplax serrata TaxID=468196 RepID=A0ABR1AI99_POLSC
MKIRQNSSSQACQVRPLQSCASFHDPGELNVFLNYFSLLEICIARRLRGLSKTDGFANEKPLLRLRKSRRILEILHAGNSGETAEEEEEEKTASEGRWTPATEMLQGNETPEIFSGPPGNPFNVSFAQLAVVKFTPSTTAE